MKSIKHNKTLKYLLKGFIPVLLVLICPLYSSADTSNKITPELLKTFSSQSSQDLIVLLDDSAVQSDLQLKISRSSGLYKSKDILSMKAAGFRSLKQNIMTAFSSSEVETVKDYNNLPMMFVKVKSSNALQKLIDNQKVLQIYPNEKYVPFLTESLPLIHQDYTAGLATPLTGTDTTVAVLDTGVDYTNSAFGPCISPDNPVDTCKVSFAQDFTLLDDGTLDDAAVRHGTNVAGIIVGVAPDTKIAALDVFTRDEFGLYALTSDIIDAIDWCIANQIDRNIVAMNLSLGASVKYKMPCTNDPFEIPIKTAKDAGILAAVAAGNDGWPDGLGTPACVPSAVSVGAVYDSDLKLGTMQWGICNDSTTAADKVTCFSNSTPFLTLLAPGSIIDAAGETMSGTSQATPHAAGTVAVLKSNVEGGHPEYTVDQTINLLKTTGKPVLDQRNGITKPRIDLRRMIITPDVTLTSNTSGSGSGTIISDPAGINCGGSCEYDFSLNTQIRLQATADPGSTFRGWSTDCSGLKPACRLTMNSVKEVTALFELPDLSGSFISISSQQKKPFVYNLSALLAVYTGAGKSDNITVKVYLSNDNAYGGDTLLGTRTITSIKQDSFRTVKLKYTSTTSFTGKYLIAVIDPDTTIAESDEGNNNVISFIH